jgi:hypothetical protein
VFTYGVVVLVHVAGDPKHDANVVDAQGTN